ncbi:Fe2+-dependent dioxygenase [Pseudomaricurvus alkylphenolicus]|uniref:Fe2+-dependent dioxygenase n=1 Tax=Pseudomaricurvus alkylphenolicus TaxID=1306991 RepID=UPI00141FC0B7|nr:Fe2+-dependent dioxygenase [Pseudomaricurvus alkylphenolicus]NIB38741.1 Fe2+-dependent dioxygenase [Pseudomaricurvus alkylphenolicus]
MLIVIEKVFTQEEVNLFRQHLDVGQWQDGKLTAGSQAIQAKTNLQLDDHCQSVQALGHEILKRLGQNSKFITAALADKIYPPKFNKYQNGGQYGTHVDSAVMTIPGSNELIRTDLSATLFFSRPEEYEGGVLTIETDFGAQEVKLNAGDLVLYPSSSLHQVTPVTSGQRVSAFFWIQSMIRDHNLRAMLYDLDQTIQSLTAKLGADAPEVLKLSSVYHNLLRNKAL